MKPIEAHFRSPSLIILAKCTKIPMSGLAFSTATTTIGELISFSRIHFKPYLSTSEYNLRYAFELYFGMTTTAIS